MAEWDRAADRLNNNRRKQPRSSGRRPVLSAAANREAQQQRQAAHQRALARARVEQQRAQRQRYMETCERTYSSTRSIENLESNCRLSLACWLCVHTYVHPIHTYIGHFGLQPLSRTGEPLCLQPTSIHGHGDKIALPPSVLEYLTSTHGDRDGVSASPWMFRIGIRSTDYVFPASPLLQNMALDDEDEEDEEDSDHDFDDDEDSHSNRYQPFMDEVHHHMYQAVTHGTVVEFTQDEGCVGLPAPMAAALIAQSNNCATMRTVDPANQKNEQVDDERSKDGAMEHESNPDTPMSDVEETTTPGHLAWGAFDLPDCPLEITLVQRLPKGRSARLRPSAPAVQNGFYGLPDIKLVLEQSLIRTRATLSLHDTIHTWHRGKQFDLEVVQVEPNEYGSVSCINTDIEVEFAEQPAEAASTSADNNSTPASAPVGQTLGGGGRRLDEPSSAATPSVMQPTAPLPSLPTEPPSDSPTSITIQLRFSDGTKLQHRFDIETATVGHLWSMATTRGTVSRLVTRFPRRVWTAADQGSTLRAVGLQPGQELVLVERK